MRKRGRWLSLEFGSIKRVNGYKWYNSDSGDIGVELGECKQGGVSEFEFICARNSYTIRESPNVIQI